MNIRNSIARFQFSTAQTYNDRYIKAPLTERIRTSGGWPCIAIATGKSGVNPYLALGTIDWVGGVGETVITKGWSSGVKFTVTDNKTTVTFDALSAASYIKLTVFQFFTD